MAKIDARIFAGLMAALSLQPFTTPGADPIRRDHHRRTRKSTKRQSWKQGPPRYGRPPCDPGTITYHDKLVKHFGRRKADEIGRRIQKGDLSNLPFQAQP